MTSNDLQWLTDNEWSTKLGETIRGIEKMTQNDNRPGPGRNYRKTAIFTFGKNFFDSLPNFGAYFTLPLLAFIQY